MRVVLLQAVALFAVVSETFAIYCYSCSSAEDGRCLDLFKPYREAIVDCDHQKFLLDGALNATLCRKITQNSNSNSNCARTFN